MDFLRAHLVSPQPMYSFAMAKTRLFDPQSTSPFVLSRAKIELFMDCPRCFYLDRRHGIARPPGFPFNLNSAVDELLKKEFDLYRLRQEPHPLMVEAGVHALPFQHTELDTWRSNFKGVRTLHPASGFEVHGAVDDVWQDVSTGELIVVDYKSTSKASEVNLDADWQDSYKRQMEIYQWLLRQKGHPVSDTGWFVYCNGIRDRERFDARLDFKISLLPYTGDAGWIEKTLQDIRSILSAAAPPNPSMSCDYCHYTKQVALLRSVDPAEEDGKEDAFVIPGAPVPEFLKPMQQNGLKPPGNKSSD